jgi:arylsulfatase A-like enzyme
LGYSDVSCFGNKLIKTPNIDKLAENGIKLTRMYSMPSDAGSMAAIQTGNFVYAYNRKKNRLII